MARLAVVNSNNAHVSLAGIPITDGRADPFISVEADEDAFGTDGTSADGHGIRFATNNQFYTVTLTLKGSSSHNQVLSGLLILDSNAPGGAGIGTFTYLDDDGATLMTSDKAWIKKLAPKEAGRAPSDVAWEITVYAPSGTMIVGGN